jgi:plastocyanin
VRPILALGAIAVLVLTLAGCTSTTSSGGNPTPNAVAGSDVTIQNFAFSPENLTVKAGTTVTWTQKDSTAHFVKWDDGTASGPQMASGDTYHRTFTAAGTYTYACGIHSSMKGTITVTP